MGGGAQFGRHFSVISGVPSLVVLLLPLGLIAAGAPMNAPSIESFVGALNNLGIADASVIAVGALIIGLVLYPLQFGFTQILEGYWGVSPPARTAMARSTRIHLRRWICLLRLDKESDAELTNVNSLIVRNQNAQSVKSSALHRTRCANLEARLLERRISSVFKKQEAIRAASRFPRSSEDFMPTKLGNMLRRHERLAGAPFGLESIGTTPYLAQIAGEEERAYLDDSRTSLDLSVRMVLVWTISAATTATLLWRHGAWLVVPLACLVLAYATYLGTIASAAQYGTALIVVTALSRQRLYESLGLQLPATSDQEIERNVKLRDVLAGFPARLTYQWPSAEDRIRSAEPNN